MDSLHVQGALGTLLQAILPSIHSTLVGVGSVQIVGTVDRAFKDVVNHCEVRHLEVQHSETQCIAAQHVERSAAQRWL